MNNRCNNMSRCYYCDGILNVDKEDHCEHIIPNGISGKLKTKGILCKDCGEHLGSEIDTYISNKFKILNNLLDIERDRKKNPSASCYALFDNRKVECVLKRGVLNFVKPYVDSNKNKIFCNIKSIKQLKTMYNNETEGTYTYETKTDKIEYLDLTSLLELTREDCLALVKIAVEFALYSGVDIQQLNVAFKRNPNDKKGKFLEPKIIPYYPLNNFEYILENTKWFFEKQRINSNGNNAIISKYPTHSLHIFSHNKKLYCFISLYSYFEFYVCLSNCFREKISKWYIESVQKIQKYKKIYDLKNASLSDIDICSQDLGISREEIMDKINSTKKGDPIIFEKEIDVKPENEKSIYYMNSIVDDLLIAINYYSKRKVVPNILEHIPIEIIDCLDSIEKCRTFSSIVADALFLTKKIEDNDYFDIDKYKTILHDGKYAIDAISKKMKDEDFKKNVYQYRKNILYKVISSSELCYPTENI